MIYEYRKYTATPGNLPVLHQRFEEAVLDLFKRYDIDVMGFWTPAVGSIISELHYIVRWPNAAKMEETWAAFMSDPEVGEVVSKFDQNGPIVASAENQIWNLTGFSPTP